MSLSVSVEEGHALEVLDLLCRGRALRISPGAPLGRPRPELVEIAARRIALSVLRTLVEGGRAHQVVLRKGRRVEGRIWDRELLQALDLRFTVASYGLWTELSVRLGNLARSAQVEEGGRSNVQARRQIRRIVKIAGTGTGDWIFYALALRHLERVPMPSEIRDDLRRRLAMGSPLAALMALEMHPGEDTASVEAQFTELLEPENVRLMECAGHLLVDVWIARIRAVSSALKVATRVERARSVAQVFATYLGVLDRAGRLDLVGPMVELLLRLTDEGGLWAGDPALVIGSLGSARDFASLAERDRLHRAYAEIVGLGAQILGARARLAGESYGDPRYEEAQLLLVRSEGLLARRERLMALAGALTHRLG